jgi:hypothetical protein
MSDRVQKPQQKKSSTVRKNKLLASLIQTELVDMPSCSNCEGKGLATCEVSPANPGRCVACVRGGLSRCDVREFSIANLENASKQFHAREAELEAAEEELRVNLAKIERLRKQKKLWFEKMMRAVRRGITSVEELEKVEKEEAAREATRVAENRPPSATSFTFDEDFIPNWNAVHGDVALSPSTIETMMPLWSAQWSETPAAAAGNSQGEFPAPMCSPSRHIPST